MTAYLIAYGREPSPAEIQGSLAFVREVEQALSKTEGTREAHERSAWNSLCHVILSANEFIYVDSMVALIWTPMIWYIRNSSK